jgi:hypothetical protein
MNAVIAHIANIIVVRIGLVSVVCIDAVIYGVRYAIVIRVDARIVWINLSCIPSMILVVYSLNKVFAHFFARLWVCVFSGAIEDDTVARTWVSNRRPPVMLCAESFNVDGKRACGKE